MELTVQKIETGLITWNYDTLKTALTEKMEKFQDIVVTEESLKDCEQTQKDLSSLRRAIDTKRKEVKKRLQEPADEFDKKCKDLLSIITGVEDPIKSGINVFEEKRKDGLRNDILEQINIFQEEFQLSPKYFNRITIADKWLNKTQKFKDTLTELHQIFSTLQVSDNAEKEDRKAIEELCRTASEGLGTVIAPKGFLDLYDLGTSLSTINGDIMREAQKRKADEDRFKEKVKEEIKPVTENDPALDDLNEVDINNAMGKGSSSIIDDGKVEKIKLELQGTSQQFSGLKQYLNRVGISYRQV